MITKNCWKNLKYFEKPPFIHQINYKLSEIAVKNILTGCLPKSMEDKWFSYCEDDYVYVHRSWTGHLMYRFSINNNCIDCVEIAMDEFVKMSNEDKIAVFLRLLPFLSENQENNDGS